MTCRRAALLVLLATGCAGAPPAEPPPLASMEEPLALLAPPDDEALRQALDKGCFSGLEVEDARESLEALLGEPEGLRVARVVENSPADAAGVLAGDLLIEATPAGGAPRRLAYPSDWRAVELEAEPGAEVEVLLDRGGRASRVAFALEPRVRPAGAPAPRRMREEERAGVVLRTATEVEARAVGLAPGGGAVVVGLARESPWRAAGVRFGDLVAAVDGEPVRHPDVLLRAIARGGGPLDLEIVREGARRAVEAPLTGRAQELKRLSVPLLVDFRRERDRASLSALLSAFRWERTPAAWQVRLLWVFTLSGGDADRLREVDA